MKLKNTIPAAILLLASACGGPGREEAARAVPVTVLTMIPVDISEEIMAPATLEGLDEALIRPAAGGRVEEVLVSEGDYVVKGTPLIRLSSDAQFIAASSAAQAGVTAASAAEQNASRSLSRMRSLHEAGAISAQELETAEAMYATARAGLQQAVAGASQAAGAADNSLITAPFDGTIGRIWVREGNMAGGGPALSITNGSTLRAEVLLPEQYSAMLAPGQEARINVISYGGEYFPGLVTAAARSVDPISGLVPVEVTFGNDDERLYPGMGGRVGISVRTSPDAMVVPDIALRRLSESVELALVVDGAAHFVPVRTGIVNRGMVEIVEGLAPGDMVIIEGQNRVSEGDAVSVRMESEAE